MLHPIQAKMRPERVDYCEEKLPYNAFDMFQEVSKGFPTGAIRSVNGEVIGFGMLRTHNPRPAFAETADVTYFIKAEHTGKGLGKLLLQFLETEGRKKGIRNILANISSLNPGSIDFHLGNGFIECGYFKEVGKKKGRFFDTIWMQKKL